MAIRPFAARYVLARWVARIRGRLYILNEQTSFELVIYRNRISIYSPGHFPKPYTPEMFAQEGLPPIPFNAAINNVLYRNGAIEQFSTGFERVFEACDAEHIHYEYKENRSTHP